MYSKTILKGKHNEDREANNTLDKQLTKFSSELVTNYFLDTFSEVLQ